MTFLQAPEDMKWLRDVHIPDLPPEYESAVVHGNEDAPAQIDAYRSADPEVGDPVAIYRPDPNGRFELQIPA